MLGANLGLLLHGDVPVMDGRFVMKNNKILGTLRNRIILNIVLCCTQRSKLHQLFFAISRDGNKIICENAQRDPVDASTESYA